MNADSVDNLMHESRVFPPKEPPGPTAHLQSFAHYEQLYQRSIDDSNAFWLEQSKTLDWITPPQKGCDYEWNSAANIVRHTWFADATLNVTVNCLDRHLENGRKDKTALIWQGEEDDAVRSFTYGELHREVCRCANALKSLGVTKGDRVCIYLPMIPELAIATLACARIGAIHSIVFGGFSALALRERINDSSCKVLITCDTATRGGKEIPFKAIADEALERCPTIERIVIIRNGNSKTSLKREKDLWYHDLIAVSSESCPAEEMDAEDPLFILYTSGSTGKPKGVVHTTGGYLLYASFTHKMVFDLQEEDIYWCTADIGWITGHSYVLYGPLANGGTTVMFEGVPTYPDCGRFWQVIEKHRVSLFYTAPTAIRSLIVHGRSWPNKYDLSSLRVLGTVGEPINPDVWMWYYEQIGQQRCPVVDTWWQTETGGIMLTPLPSTHTLKPGSATRPFFGISPTVLRPDGTPCAPNEGGDLCISRPWPGMMRTTWGDHQRFIDTYFKTHDNLYFSGDGCRRDEEGDYWLMGRIDDVVNISGHRIGTAEVESALVSHPAVAEAAVVPAPHPIKGQSLYAFVTLKHSAESDAHTLKAHVREEIGPIATPETVQFAAVLPKTRSGKIMRRILRKIAENDIENLGDTSTLADPTVVDTLIAERRS